MNQLLCQLEKNPKFVKNGRFSGNIRKKEITLPKKTEKLKNGSIFEHNYDHIHAYICI